jgi:chemotaxis methyl-accepting protein methylase/pimeloyl-ACP methyl ester carboxylesterase
MGKRSFVNGFLLLGLCWGVSSPVWGARLLDGRERGLFIRPTNNNYYIATLLGESEHYDPTFYDDHEVLLGDKPVLQFTQVDGMPVDFYYHVTAPEDLALVEQAFRRERSRLDAVSPELFDSFERYRSIDPSYIRRGLYSQVAAALKGIAPVAPQKVLGDDHSSEDVDNALDRYLRSNGVSSLSQLSGRPELVRMLVNKFYLLSTTYFYRDYPTVKAFLGYLDPLRARAAKEKRPLKLKVFACSTGEEVITYAVELAEAGVQDFTILATDINEPGLRRAAGMTYAMGAFERLPGSFQEKLKKYFRLDSAAGVWVPKDPEFFHSRIRYQTQDLLKDLPKNLDPRFAPPYDLVSILNVLFYLEDAVVQARKDAWADLLAPGGILVLHDFHYSLLAGTLGREWAFQRFRSVNDWVNIKASPHETMASKTSFYEEAYRRDPTETSFLSLLSAYGLSGRADDALRLCQDYLSLRPNSPLGWTASREFHLQQRKTKEASSDLRKLRNVNLQRPEVLGWLAEEAQNPKDRAFLKALKEAQSVVILNQRGRPEAVAEAFNLKETPGSPQEYGPLLPLLKANALASAQGRFSVFKNHVEAERVGLEALDLVEQAAPLAPENLLGLQTLDMASRELMEDYADDGAEDKILRISEKVLRLLDGPYKGTDAFSVEAARARSRLYQSLAHQQAGRFEAAVDALEKSAQSFDKALAYREEMSPGRRAMFLGDAGRAFTMLSRLRRESGRTLDAEAAESRAFELLEEGLSINPLYGKKLHTWRQELLKQRRGAGLRIGPVPLAGEILKFRDAYGPYPYKSEVVRYKTEDGADIEATLLTPDASAPKRPGLVFVPMWARDRMTWWGFPEFMASHGYASIYMDIRGHGGSHFPGSDRRVTIKDNDEKKRDYIHFVRDAIPAFKRLREHPSVQDHHLVVVGASLGVPVGLLAAEKWEDDIVGAVMLAPALAYFGVDCSPALEKLGERPFLSVAEKSDPSFRGAKEFFSLLRGYRTFLQTEHLGHGTDALYWDAGLPSVILRWLEDLQSLSTPLRRLKATKPLLRLKK